jgi:hypothetical protein
MTAEGNFAVNKFHKWIIVRQLTISVYFAKLYLSDIFFQKVRVIENEHASNKKCSYIGNHG